MITAMLLELVDVDRVRILDDYEDGVRADNAWLVASPANHRQLPKSEASLSAHLAVARIELDRFLTGVDVASYLIGAGLTPAQLARIRARLLDA
jgi:hypothetical protein